MSSPLRTLGVLALMFLAGCSFLHPWATDRDVDGTYDQVFQATLEMLEARGFPIAEADRVEGRIVTEHRPVRVLESRRRVEQVRARIEGEGEETEVTLFLTFMDQTGSVRSPKPVGKEGEAEMATSKMLSSSAAYDAYLDAIEERVREYREGS